MEQQTIRIKYHSNEIEKLTYIDGKSDWIDLRSAEHVVLKKGEFKLIKLGVSMQLPAGYEAVIVPRSSTYKNFGIIQTNHMGVVDESYCGDDDVWMMPALAMRDTEINVNDRICQFRIQKHQPVIRFEETDTLGNENRGGIGSTGRALFPKTRPWLPSHSAPASLSFPLSVFKVTNPADLRQSPFLLRNVFSSYDPVLLFH